MLWLLYVIISSFFFALGNILEKIVVNKYVRVTNIYGYTILTFFVYGIGAIFLFPFSQLKNITAYVILLVILRAIQNLLYYYFWIKLMLKEEMSRIIGILFLYTIIAFFLDYLFFTTKISVIFYLGAMLLILSAIIMSYKPSKKSFIEKKDIFYFIIIIVLWGFYGVLLKLITTQVSTNTFLFLETTTVLLTATIITLFSKKVQEQIKPFAQLSQQTKIFWIVVLAVTICYITGLLTSFKAYSLQVISYVAPFETLQPTFVFGIALFLSFFAPNLLKEEIDGKTIVYKIVALVLLIVGILLILLPDIGIEKAFRCCNY